MKKLIDLRPKKNPTILDNFLILPDSMPSKKTKALANIKNLLKWELKNVETL